MLTTNMLKLCANMTLSHKWNIQCTKQTTREHRNMTAKHSNSLAVKWILTDLTCCEHGGMAGCVTAMPEDSITSWSSDTFQWRSVTKSLQNTSTHTHTALTYRHLVRAAASSYVHQFTSLNYVRQFYLQLTDQVKVLCPMTDLSP